jgi:uncharacterized repeat protein (TIGR03803 family)
MKERFTLVFVFVLLAGLAFAANPQSTAVHTFLCNGHFLGPCPNGGRPDSLIQGSDGNFYGASQVTFEETSHVVGGNVFSLTPGGAFKILHTFTGGANESFQNGDLPGSLIEGPDGRLYGETIFGGVDGCDGDCGYGVLFRVSRNGSGFQIIHQFCSEASCADGYSPTGLAVGNDGNLYGTTLSGGTGNEGTIFRVTPSSGAYEVAVNCTSSTSGASPSGLMAAPDGTFYGMSSGTASRLLFHYTEATGDLTTAPLNFPLFNNLPSAPVTGLKFGPNGNLYGVYEIYGEDGAGLFEVEPGGSNLQLFSFYNAIDGGGEPDGLLLASDGNFWVADFSGSSGFGDIIELSPTDGTLLETLTPFGTSSSVGEYPAEIIQAKDGTLWGSTYYGGDPTQDHFADGTVFSLDAGLPPR